MFKAFCRVYTQEVMEDEHQPSLEQLRERSAQQFETKVLPANKARWVLNYIVPHGDIRKVLKECEPRKLKWEGDDPSPVSTQATPSEVDEQDHDEDFQRIDPSIETSEDELAEECADQMGTLHPSHSSHSSPSSTFSAITPLDRPRIGTWDQFVLNVDRALDAYNSNNTVTPMQQAVAAPLNAVLPLIATDDCATHLSEENDDDDDHYYSPDGYIWTSEESELWETALREGEAMCKTLLEDYRRMN